MLPSQLSSYDMFRYELTVASQTSIGAITPWVEKIALRRRLHST